jgi:NDP-sugar pyrophosphorylase family protein
MKAIILAAGKGERLRPLTDSTQKVMIEVGGKPCLQHSIELLRKYGITEIAINTYYLPEKIKEYFKDGSEFGVSIRYSYEPEILGTAGALNNFRDFLRGEFFVVYGDVIHRINFEEMMRFHRSMRGLTTIALDNRSQKGKGAVVLNGNRIVRFVEKPKEEIPGALVNSGVYLTNHKIFDYIPQQGFSDFGYHVLPSALRAGERLYGLKIEEVIDIGTIEDLERARALFRQP